jgi:hypothetical protein
MSLLFFYLSILTTCDKYAVDIVENAILLNLGTVGFGFALADGTMLS